MRIALRVFDALASAPADLVGVRAPLTRQQIEGRTGLVGDEVKKGLVALKRRDLLLIAGASGQRATYALRPNAARPLERRGCYVRNGNHRALQASLRLVALGRACALTPYHPASPPSHASAPGAARLGRAHRIAAATVTELPSVLGLAGLLKWRG